MSILRFISILSLILSSSFALAVSNNVFDNLDIGMSILSVKTDSNDESQTHGVLLMNYDGYHYGMKGGRTLDILPTSVEMDVNGEKVKVFAEAATMEFFKDNQLDLEFVVSAIKIEYEKNERFMIRKSEKLSLLDVGVNKYIELGDLYGMGEIEVNIGGSVGIGGYYNSSTSVAGVDYDINDKHRYTADVYLDVLLPVTSSLELIFHVGYETQVGNITQVNTKYGGVSLNGISFGGEKNIQVTPYYNYVQPEAQANGKFFSDDVEKVFGINFTYKF